MPEQRAHISVVIPVYNAARILPELYRQLQTALRKISEDYEIIFVNDACPQNSWSVIEDICKQDTNVVGIDFSRNFGQMKAVTAGLDYAQGDWVVVMDCDLQYYPEDIALLYAKAQEGYDIVYSQRKNRVDKPLTQFFSKAFYRVLSFFSGVDYNAQLSTFSICSRVVVESYREMREQYRAYILFLRWLGFRSTIIEIEHHERYEGRSSYTFRKRMQEAYMMIFAQSNRLLSISVKFGALMSLLSFIAIIVLIVQYFTLDVPAGWSSTVVSIFFVGGLILMSLGIIGIYLGEVINHSRNRPLYVVRSIVNQADASEKGQE
ncbi:MAG: glycosyltransferase family 2 protein [Coriobacteriales bacterium]|nr:glycosyltransferase family 2 protein [Coriobacteriales bacterium]